MSIGTPVVFTKNRQERNYAPLPAISTRLQDQDAFQEELLQDVIHRCPTVLPVREFAPTTTTLISLGTEIGVDIGDYRGRIDNLLVTNEGLPVIAETKLHRNPEATREVVAQTLQYGMAISRMSLLQFEDKIKSANPNICSGKSLRDCVISLAGERGPELIADDFEDALERHLRRGELLLLIVSDSFRVGVERVTSWLNEYGNSAPFKFGLVELKFYSTGDQMLVVPRAVLKTREVSRHTVVVDVRPSVDVSLDAQVRDDFQSPFGGRVQQMRSVHAATMPLTPGQLLETLPLEEQPIARDLIERLSEYGFDQGNTTTAWLQFGLTYPAEGGEFHPLLYLGKKGVSTYPLGRVRNLLGDDEMIKFHQRVNRFGEFFRPDQIEKPASQGAIVSYQQLRPGISAFVEYLDGFRDQVQAALQTEEPR